MIKFWDNIKYVTKSFIRIITLKDLRSHFSKKHYVLLSLSVLLNIVNSLSRLIAPAAFGRALEMLAKSEQTIQIAELNFSYVELLYLSICLSIWLRYEDDMKELLMLHCTNTLTENMSLKLSGQAHELPLNDHIKIRNDINYAFLKIQNNCSRLMPETVFSLYPGIMDMLIGLSFTCKKYGANISLTFLAFILVNLFISNNLLSKLLRVNEKNNTFDQANHHFLSHEYEMLIYEETVRIHNRISFEIFQTKQLLNFLNSSRRIKTIANSLFNIGSIIPLALATIFLVYYLNLDHLNLEDIDDAVLLLAYFTTIGSNLIRFNRSFHVCLSALTAFDGMEKLMKRTLLHLPDINIDYLSSELAFKVDHSPSIEFQNVNFSYEEDKPVLKNLTFKILAGSSVGIAGRSGSGKSTIIKLLFRLHEPDSGVIKINDTDIKQIPIPVLRSIIAYIPNSTDIFQNESLLFNILYGADEKYLRCLKKIQKNKLPSLIARINDEKTFLKKSLIRKTENEDVLKEGIGLFKQSMQRAKLKAFIKNKYDHNVQMSTGQKQQLNLARGLAKQSCIFVVDELTAPLDSFSEQKVLKNVRKLSKHKTTLMIAHRLSTIKNADDILVIEDGSLIEQGTHENLLNKQGVYYNYYKLQHM